MTYVCVFNFQLTKPLLNLKKKAMKLLKARFFSFLSNFVGNDTQSLTIIVSVITIQFRRWPTASPELS